MAIATFAVRNLSAAWWASANPWGSKDSRVSVWSH